MPFARGTALITAVPGSISSRMGSKTTTTPAPQHQVSLIWMANLMAVGTPAPGTATKLCKISKLLLVLLWWLPFYTLYERSFDNCLVMSEELKIICSRKTIRIIIFYRNLLNQICVSIKH